MSAPKNETPRGNRAATAKAPRGLKLSKETLRQLTDRDLARVAGAASGNTGCDTIATDCVTGRGLCVL
jgi:hypothetical protein